MRGRTLVTSAAVVVVLTALVGGRALANAPGPVQPPGTTFGGIHLVAFQQYGNQPTTAADYALIARSNAMVVAQPRVMAQIGPLLKALNPRILLLIYENGMFSTKTDPAGMPESWYLHDSSGRRVVSKVQRNTLMNPLSTAAFAAGGSTYDGWPDYVAQECARDQQLDTSGCYLDMLGPAPLQPSYSVGGTVPVDPRTGLPFDPLAYEAITGSTADAARHLLPVGSTVIGNGYSNGMAYFTRGTSQLNDHTDSAQAQSWLGNNDLAQSVRQWRRSVQMIIDNATAGSSMIVHYGASRSANLDAQRTFALATYLLGNTGHAYFDFAANGLHTWEDWSPLYDVALGVPTETASTVDGYLKNGVYQRTYTGGMVIVNPGSTTATIQLGAEYHTLSGQATASVTIAPHSAMILVS